MKQISSPYQCRTIILIAILYMSTAMFAQQKQPTLNMNLNHVSLAEFTRQIEEALGYTFIYGEDVKLSHPISMKVKDVSLSEALNQAFNDQPIRYEIQLPHIILKKKEKKVDQTKPDGKKHTISGFVTDEASGETLIGTNVLEGIHQTGTATNQYGFYTLTIPAGDVSIDFSYLGYETRHAQFTLHKDTVLNVKMLNNNMLQEVVITSDRKEAGLQSVNPGAVEIPLTQIQNTPTILGEADILKTIQLMPGVQAGTDGFSGLYVRGGSSDQNLVMLDGIPIYNADHLFGIFSVFQPEAVKTVTLFKGSFPARYGGRVSSVVDVRTNDGNMKELKGTLSIGSLTSKLHLEGPIIKDKTSFSFSARGVHTLLFQPFSKKLRNTNYYFADVNTKVNHKFSDRSRAFLNIYWGEDKYKWADNYNIKLFNKSDEDYRHTYKDNQRLNWGNFIVAGRWNYVFSNKLFGNAAVAFNKYHMQMKGSNNEVNVYKGNTSAYSYKSDYRSGIEDWSAKLDLDYTPLPHHLMKFGSEFIFHTFRPEVLNSKIKERYNNEMLTDTIYQSATNSEIYGRELTLYGEDNYNINDNLTLNIGVHLNGFYTQGKSYYSIQPRLSAKYRLSNDWIFKAAYSQMAQYVHLLSSTQLAMPTDLWVPITKNIKPMTADQFSTGVYFDGIKGWEFSLEGYYKQLHHLLEYQEGVSVMGNSSHWENKVEMGEGRSLGTELLVQKTTGKTTGWLAYTLSKTDRQFKNGFINNGQRFPYKYDRRHNLNIVMNHRFNFKWDISASWIFNSGGYIIVPERVTYSLTPDGEGHYDAYISHRNNYHLPSSHRLNLSINLHHRTKKRAEGIWNLSIYNVYNAMNPNLVYAETETTGSSYDKEEDDLYYQTVKTKIKKLTILPIFPSFSYTLKF